MIIVENYNSYFADAPDYWKEDGFFRDHVPISIACRYGQNISIGDNEGDIWARERDYSKIQFVSVALASHLNASRVKERVDVDLETFLQKHGDGEWYSSPDPNDPDRKRYTKDTLPPVTDDGNRAIPIYNEEGYLVRRQTYHVDGRPLALLVDLKTIEQFFDSAYHFARRHRREYDDDDEEDDEDEYAMDIDENVTHTTVHVYPQAFLRRYGHFRANGLPPQFTPFIKTIERRVRVTPAAVGAAKRKAAQARLVAIRRKRSGDDDGRGSLAYEHVEEREEQSSDEEEDDLTFGGRVESRLPVIIPVACQGYNELSHRSRPTAGLHDVQQGLITSVMAGAFAEDPRSKRIAQTVKAKCEQSLPHERFAAKVGNHPARTALRMENVIVILMDNVDERKRDGKYLVRYIIRPMIRAWGHPMVLDPLLDHVVAMPAKVRWM
ncbi:hypothetical protein OBBRIDRAFT_840366 [Obba rivulosa]|uniref:Uncharacterized protein n=1 Tax=Obba rivulosa TaxID=1052685 RepID=A0A8E2AQZ8_9APHY|nr:hypothetical protein OBBRIDRAFT_840366 [Obba rivulosa]